MMTLRPAAERGHANHGWLDSHHTFSFADYYDPKHMSFRSLRVINDDRVRAGAGFPSHPHSNMEIVSYVLEGALAHKDSMGNGSTIVPGDVQRMSAGTGIRHSEFNASQDELVHFLQVWILPSKTGIAPSYEQKTFSRADKKGRLRIVASSDGREGSVSLHADVAVYAGVFEQGDEAELAIAPGRHSWVHVASGKMRVNGKELSEGDGAALSEERHVRIEGVKDGEVLVFDLA